MHIPEKVESKFYIIIIIFTYIKCFNFSEFIIDLVRLITLYSWPGIC